jgi:outer membrane protein OmpA-like peptidoglycan-associated protein
MYFEGALYGGEFNLIFSFTNLYQTKAVKWHSAGYFGVGYHQYNSQLFEKNITGGKDTPIVDFGTNPARNSVNAASSIYLSAQLGVKRRISKKLDLELRSGMYFNYEDHLDATISNKQNWETFFVTSIGVVMNIGKNKVYTIWDDDTPKQPNFQIIDTDKDGVMDQLDKEPNTPPGVMVYGNGVGIDSDKDGIQDHVDSCPLKYGPLSNKGCPLPKDSDQDGIIDVEDLCPLVAGTVSNKGCPLPKDTDQDGIIDVEDLCPLVPGTVSNKGCPEDEKIQVAETVEIENKIALFATNIYFDTNSDQIQKISLPIIAKIIGLMKKVPNITFIIEGHTDDRSSKQYNLELSQRRANAIKKYISNAGIDQQRLEAKGFGELQPKFSNQNLNGRKLNRRVEIKPTGKI